MTFSLIFVLSISAPVGCQFFAFSSLFPHPPFPTDKKNHEVFFTQPGPAASEGNKLLVPTPQARLPPPS